MNTSQNPMSKPISGIKCDVTNCHYNDLNHHCIAREITVGPQFANSSADTVCATFKPGGSTTTGY